MPKAAELFERAEEAFSDVVGIFPDDVSAIPPDG